MFCRYCGREVTGKPQFCPWCGQPIGEDLKKSESEQNIYSESCNQNEKKSRRNYTTAENIERYAPIASFSPVVAGLISLVCVILSLLVF